MKSGQSYQEKYYDKYILIFFIIDKKQPVKEQENWCAIIFFCKVVIL